MQKKLIRKEKKYDVFYCVFDNNKEKNEFILSKILNGEAKNILFKGNPRKDLLFKHIKKILFNNQKFSLEKAREEWEIIVNDFDEQNFALVLRD